ncbi:aldehyde dehydrogenase, dimeric NADP-preferring-like [Cloeon dipterum]|uniref:aldehyde dehydrogenase, dimeric NADP-preferring-like n=1 Tax=Cloeon dipterum TaxID=197152 RepID=UPI00321FEEEA
MHQGLSQVEPPKTEMCAANYSDLLCELRAAFESGRTLSEEFRRRNLQRLLQLYEENTKEILAALKADLGKNSKEANLLELGYIKSELQCTLFKLHKWMNPPKPYKNIMYFFDDVRLINEPLGVVLIIGPYNYPLKLISIPLHGAIASGNCVVLKPSHLTPQTSALIASLVPKYLDPECFKVVLADAAGTQELLENKFDYIFATCSNETGRVVAAAAARQMTPSSIQMGGKCPVFLDEHIKNFDTAVKRIAYAKTVNVGQMCMAPDYILCTPRTRDKFVTHFQETMQQFFTDDMMQSEDLGKIVNKEHVKRLEKMLSGTKGRVVFGGDVDADRQWVSPTLVVDVPQDDTLMQAEIFGPILPVVCVESAEEAVRFIRARDKPLVVYLFSETAATHELFRRSTYGGALSINECIVYSGIEDLPFGGVGASGMGPKYHGHSSYLTFTNQKGMQAKKLNWFSELMARPKYPRCDSTLGKMLIDFALTPRRQDRTRLFIYSGFTLMAFTALLFCFAVIFFLTENRVTNSEATDDYWTCTGLNPPVSMEDYNYVQNNCSSNSTNFATKNIIDRFLSFGASIFHS